jgi:hypothetical protein
LQSTLMTLQTVWIIASTYIMCSLLHLGYPD